MKIGIATSLFLFSISLFSQPVTIPIVAINELMASNSKTAMDPAGEYDDWVELYNNTNNNIDLSNWYLSDDYLFRKKWKFPVGSSIASNGFLIIWCDSQLNQTGIHTIFKLNKGGEQLILSMPDTSVIDSLNFGKQITDTSYARIPNGNGPWQLDKPTFNGPNSPVGINVSKPYSRFNFVPNPASSKILISGEEINSIKIYDLSFKEVLFIPKREFEDHIEIDIHDFQNGMYYLQIEQNGNIQMRTLIVSQF